MNQLLDKAEQAIHDLLLEIYARDGSFNNRAKEIHDLMIEIKRRKQ